MDRGQIDHEQQNMACGFSAKHASKACSLPKAEPLRPSSLPEHESRRWCRRKSTRRIGAVAGSSKQPSEHAAGNVTRTSPVAMCPKQVKRRCRGGGNCIFAIIRSAAHEVNSEVSMGFAVSPLRTAWRQALLSHKKAEFEHRVIEWPRLFLPATSAGRLCSLGVDHSRRLDEDGWVSPILGPCSNHIGRVHPALGLRM